MRVKCSAPHQRDSFFPGRSEGTTKAGKIEPGGRCCGKERRPLQEGGRREMDALLGGTRVPNPASCGPASPRSLGPRPRGRALGVGGRARPASGAAPPPRVERSPSSRSGSRPSRWLLPKAGPPRPPAGLGAPRAPGRGADQQMPARRRGAGSTLRATRLAPPGTGGARRG